MVHAQGRVLPPSILLTVTGRTCSVAMVGSWPHPRVQQLAMKSLNGIILVGDAGYLHPEVLALGAG